MHPSPNSHPLLLNVAVAFKPLLNPRVDPLYRTALLRQILRPFLEMLAEDRGAILLRGEEIVQFVRVPAQVEEFRLAIGEVLDELHRPFDYGLRNATLGTIGRVHHGRDECLGEDLSISRRSGSESAALYRS